MKKEKKKEEKLPKPVMPSCNKCKKPLIHCTCEDNDLKK